MHGGEGNARQFYNRSYALNDILDHAIENGELVNSLDYVAWFMPLSGDCRECRTGGSTINGAFARAGVIDELSLVQAPLIADKDDEMIFHDANGGEYQLIRR